MLVLDDAGRRRTPKVSVYFTGKVRKTVLFSPLRLPEISAVLWSDWGFQDWTKPTLIRPKATSKTEKFGAAVGGCCWGLLMGLPFT
jgi:hypothetical protein